MVGGMIGYYRGYDCWIHWQCMLMEMDDNDGWINASNYWSSFPTHHVTYVTWWVGNEDQ